MGRLIHARTRPDGFRYRVWSTNVDGYLTAELTETELDKWLLDDEIEHITDRHRESFPRQIARANVKGTTDTISRETQDLDGPWEEERQPYDDDESGPAM